MQSKKDKDSDVLADLNVREAEQDWAPVHLAVFRGDIGVPGQRVDEKLSPGHSQNSPGAFDRSDDTKFLKWHAN